jgi:hypothetical protein
VCKRNWHWNWIFFLLFRFLLFLVTWLCFVLNKRTAMSTKRKKSDHLRMTTPCLQRPPYCSHIWNLYLINDFWTTATCQQRPVCLGSEGDRCKQVLVCLFFYIIYHFTIGDASYCLSNIFAILKSSCDPVNVSITF